jgi:hypothetical protein
MARSLFVEAQLPKMLWFCSVREAVQRMNFIPVEVPMSEVTAKVDHCYAPRVILQSETRPLRSLSIWSDRLLSRTV